MLPSLSLLEKIQKKIRITPNKQGEYKQKTHYCCYLLCEKAGLRVSEAVNFDLSKKTRKGLYRLNKTKGKKKRYVYIPKKVINELKKHDWKPNNTNRFNFYHFLRKIKHEINLPTNTELTPHTLRRSFATYHAENGLPLPLLSKLLGHKSVRTTALYWMNIYHGGDDDDDNDVGSILVGKNWLEKPPKPQPEPEALVNLSLDELPELLIPNLLVNEQQPDYLNEIQQLEQQLTEKDQKIAELTAEKETLRNDLAESNEQNANLRQNLNNLSHQKVYETNQREKVQQDLAATEKIIKQLEQKLAAAENNLFTERQNNQFLKETNANLAQKLHASEQNLANLQNTYQNAIKAKETAEEKLTSLLVTIKAATKQFQQWQKINYYRQLEREQGELKAQIVQPPPWKMK